MSLLEAVAIAPPQAELWLLETLEGSELEGLEVCLSSGMLAPTGHAVAFRHELARLRSRPRSHRSGGSRCIKRCPRAGSTTPTEPSISPAWHITPTGPVTRRQCCGSHRAQPSTRPRSAPTDRPGAVPPRALRYVSDLPPAARAEILERQAHESFLSDQFDVSIASGQEAVEQFQEAGDQRRAGDVLRQHSSHLRCTGHPVDEAQAAASAAVTLLEELPPGRELALAYCNLASLSLNADDADGTAMFGQRALALAEELDDTRGPRAHPEHAGHGRPPRRPRRRPALARTQPCAGPRGRARGARRPSVHQHRLGIEPSRDYAGVTDLLRSGIDYCDERGLVLWQQYLVAYLVRVAFDEGRWSEAIELSQPLLRDPLAMLPRPGVGGRRARPRPARRTRRPLAARRGVRVGRADR